MGQWAHVGSFEASRFLRAIGRLAPGFSLGAASAAAEPLVRRLESPERRSARLISLVDDQIGRAARPLWLMLAGAGLLLLLACSNVAGLLLGEGRVRRHEIAVRLALGGSRCRLLRQLAIENLLLAAAAGTAGLMLAVWLTPSLVAVAPDRLPGIDAVGVDFRIAAFALCLSLATTLLFGLAPAISLSAIRPAEALSDGRRESTPGGRRGQLAIVAAQFGLALVLLVCTSLFGETMMRLASQPLGFDSSDLAVASIRLTQYPHAAARPKIRPPLTAEAVPRLREEADRYIASGWIHTAGVIARLSALPGVVAVAGVGTAPFSGGLNQARIRAYGRPQEDAQSVHQQIVTEGYFKTMGMPILRGRGFDLSDRQGAFAAVVSRELERRFFAGSAVGQRLVEWETVYDVVGVVSNAKQREFTDKDLATFYLLDRQFGSVNHFIVRTSGDATAVIPLVRQTVWNYDKSMVSTSTATMDQLLAESISQQRFRALLSAVFSGAALVLAAIGLYGLAARRVAERRREIGIRVALGASPRDVRALVLHDAQVIVGLGVIGGLPAALAASQITRSFLFGVSPTAPHVFLIASGVLAVIAIVATLVPAHRASHIHPMLALRE
jgi:putative ABC transport system permease protein